MPSSPAPSAETTLTAMLRSKAERIRELERLGDAALHEQHDTPAYRLLMAEKAELILDLPDEVEPLLRSFPANEAKRVEAALHDMARRAGQALDLDSVFYMARLLHPDDRTDEAPSELEQLIRELETRTVEP